MVTDPKYEVMMELRNIDARREKTQRGEYSRSMHAETITAHTTDRW